MRVLLIYPPFMHERSFRENVEAPPIGLFYLAASLKAAGHEVEIANLHDADPEGEAAAKAIRDFDPDAVGISAFNANRKGAMAAAKAAKERDPDCPVIVGGIGATALPGYFLRPDGPVDYVILGEGEATLPALLQALAHKGDPLSVPGLAHLGPDGRPASTGPAQPIEDLDSLPMPAEHFDFIHLSLSRGCPGSCAFCGTPAFWGRKVRHHSAGYFVRQLELLHARGANFFYFSDDTFTLKKPLVMEICALIREKLPDITWAAISRVDRVDPDMLKAMRLAGCIQLSFGVESGSETIRRNLNKNTKTEDIERAFSLARSHGILPRAYIIYGSPGETDQTVQESLDLLARVKPLITLFHVLTVFPGTELYERFKAAYPAADEIWDKPLEDILYFEMDRNMSDEDMRRWGETLKKGYFQALPGFARDIELVDDPELAACHADFLSRLAMTFDHGDYASLLPVAEKDELAASLYSRALELAQDPRALLGLGMQANRAKDFDKAVELLGQGRELHPDDESMAVYLALALMNQGKFQEAVSHLLPFDHSKNALARLVDCYEALNDFPNKMDCFKRLHSS